MTYRWRTLPTVLLLASAGVGIGMFAYELGADLCCPDYPDLECTPFTEYVADVYDFGVVVKRVKTNKRCELSTTYLRMRSSSCSFKWSNNISDCEIFDSIDSARRRLFAVAGTTSASVRRVPEDYDIPE